MTVVAAAPAAPHALVSILGAYMSDHTIGLIEVSLISFVGWNILNLIIMNLNLPDKHLPREEMLDMRNRIVSFFHGFAIMLLAGYNTYFVHSQCGEKNTAFEETLMGISNGYFAYDLVAMAYLGICDRAMFIHHMICITGLSSGLFTGHAADILVGALFLTEISNPCMHVRVVLKHLGLRYTKAYETLELSYIRKYFSIRFHFLLPKWICHLCRPVRLS